MADTMAEHRAHLAYPDISLISEVTDVSDTSLYPPDHTIGHSSKRVVYDPRNYEDVDLDLSLSPEMKQKQVRFNPAVAVAVSSASKLSLLSSSMDSKPSLPPLPLYKLEGGDISARSLTNVKYQAEEKEWQESSSSSSPIDVVARTTMDCRNNSHLTDNVIDSETSLSCSSVTDVTSLSQLTPGRGISSVLHSNYVELVTSGDDSRPPHLSPTDWEDDAVPRSTPRTFSLSSGTREESSCRSSGREPYVRVYDYQTNRKSTKAQCRVLEPEETEVIVQYEDEVSSAWSESVLSGDEEPSCQADLITEDHQLGQPRVHLSQRYVDKMEKIINDRYTKPTQNNPSLAAMSKAENTLSSNCHTQQQLSERAGLALNHLDTRPEFPPLVELDPGEDDIINIQQRKARQVERKAQSVIKKTKVKSHFPAPDPLEFFDPLLHYSDMADLSLHSLPNLLPELMTSPPEIDAQLYEQYQDRLNLNW